jgi:hypothetical protein
MGALLRRLAWIARKTVALQKDRRAGGDADAIMREEDALFEERQGLFKRVDWLAGQGSKLPAGAEDAAGYFHNEAEAEATRLTGNLPASTEGALHPAEPPKDTPAPRLDKRQTTVEQDDGRNLPPEAAPEPVPEALPDEPLPPGELARRNAVALELADSAYGHGAVRTSTIGRAWKKIMDVLRGARGATPELPAFPFARWNRTASVENRRRQLGRLVIRNRKAIAALRAGVERHKASKRAGLENDREKGWLAGRQAEIEQRERMQKIFEQKLADLRVTGRAYLNRIKEGQRELATSNDYVEKMAEEDLRGIVKPLVDAGKKTGWTAKEGEALRKAQERIRLLMAEGKKIPDALVERRNELQRRLEEGSPYFLFSRIIFFMDLQWRLQNLKDSAGNPIAVARGMNIGQVDAELARLGAVAGADKERLRMVTAAIGAHMGLVKRVATDMKDRGLMVMEHVENPFYFPHIVLERRKGERVEQRETRVERVRPDLAADFRGYLLEPVGSVSPIEGDYMRAMYHHLTQVGAHNQKEDIINDFYRSYDVMDEAREIARQLSTAENKVSWEQVFHTIYEPMGYVLHRHVDQNFFPVETIAPEKLAKALGELLEDHASVEAMLEGARGKPITVRSEDIMTVFQGMGRETLILPSPVSDALKGIQERANRPARDAMQSILGAALTTVKLWKLFTPGNHIRYELNNCVADAEKIIRDTPGTLRKFPQAAREVAEYFRTGKMNATLRSAVRLGVIDSVTAREVGNIANQPGFGAFETGVEKAHRELLAAVSAPGYAAIRGLAKLLGRDGPIGRANSKQISAFREGMTRYANFLNNLERIKNGARPEYGGSYWRDIDAMLDTRPGANDRAERQAATISRDTFVDYNNISEMGKHLRGRWVLFYSWIEGNFKYHANIMRNMRDVLFAPDYDRKWKTAKGLDDASMSAARKALKAVMTGAAPATLAARKAAGLGLKLAWFTSLAAMPYLLTALWNGRFPDEEDELSEEDKRRVHITWGRDANDNPSVTYLALASNDVLKWFGGERAAQAVMLYLTGKVSFDQAFHIFADKLGSDIANGPFQGVGPTVKVPYMLAARKQPHPDVTDQRNIPAHDLRRTVLSEITDRMTADFIERAINKEYYPAKDLREWAMQNVFQVRARDPLHWAYYGIKEKADDFMEARTGIAREPGANNSPDQQAIKNFRRAIFKGDPEQAARFHELLTTKYGYTVERLRATVKAMEPLAAIARENRREFYDGLDDAEKREVVRAYRYWGRLKEIEPHAVKLFPVKKSGETGRLLYANSARDISGYLSGLVAASAEQRKAAPEIDEQRAMEMLEAALSPKPQAAGSHKPARPSLPRPPSPWSRRQ